MINSGVLSKALANRRALRSGRCVLGKAMVMTSNNHLGVPTKAAVGTHRNFDDCLLMTRNNGLCTSNATSGPIVFATGAASPISNC